MEFLGEDSQTLQVEEEGLGMLPVEKWTDSDVSTWMRSIGVKEEYIQQLEHEEVNGQILLGLTEDDLKELASIKPFVARFIIRKRNELVDAEAEAQPKAQLDQCLLHSKKDSKPRPFGKEGIDFTYVKHSVLQPESGLYDLIYPCHEYKSFMTAATLDRTRLQAKFAKEVLKFGTGCMNIRSNGTIHFGVMDSKDDEGYVHGEIIGFPVLEKDMYIDALDHIEKAFTTEHSEDVRKCIRPPQFIEVMDITSAEKRYVVEVDIVPSISIVKHKVYSVCLPNFKESSNKIEKEKKTVYCRVGAKTEPVKDENTFYQRVRERDAQREEAEQCPRNPPDIVEDLGRKLTMLISGGKKFIDNEKWYILVTNKFTSDDLDSIDFLLNLKIFCVFDFDPDSKRSGLCSQYTKHHAANLHFLQSYKIPSNMTVEEFEGHLHLFEQTSWIFCNGRNDYQGNEIPSDEMLWIKTKLTLLKESVSLICKQILPKGLFSVVFLLTSPVEKPFLHTFSEFFTDMNGHEDIICISESEECYQKWQSFADTLCETAIVKGQSVVGMKMSHVDATLRQIQAITSRAYKQLPLYVQGQCHLKTCKEETLHSLEIISVDHCDETSDDFIKEEKDKIEKQFYHGGRIAWLNFWLAEKKFVGEVIQRDAYREVSKCLSGILKRDVSQAAVNIINIYHQPGSGGSTVARQVLWNNRKDLRCAVVKPSYSATTVAEHAIQLREYEEKDPQKCLPVLLLVEDSKHDYTDDLRKELEVAINTKKVNQGTLCFIVLSCSFSFDPDKMCKKMPLQNFAVTQKLSPEEKRQFSTKREILVKQYQPEFILTFVLMSDDFEPRYVQKYVKFLLKDINHDSIVTRLILYVALLNTYVENSFISQSHCEALLSFTMLTTASQSDQRETNQMKRFSQYAFDKLLSDQAKLLFTGSKDDKTHIQAIKIIHPNVAKVVLQQLLDDKQTLEKIAMDLLHEDVLFEHRFARQSYVMFLKDLFMRRYKVNEGDKSDTLFSPLIEIVRNKTPNNAIQLLEEAHKRFNEDAFFAQQLARLNYVYEMFDVAEKWAIKAEKKLPNNSYILDTKGQVYKRWFENKCKFIQKKTIEHIADPIETALKALECFHKCEQIAMSDRETMNNAGFFGKVTVGLSLLALISSLPLFSDRTTNGRTERLNYLLNEDYIPEDVLKPWEKYHGQLKNLQKNLQDSMEWISEDLSFFQTDFSSDEEEESEKTQMKGKQSKKNETLSHISEKIKKPTNWLIKKSIVYGKTFNDASVLTVLKQCESNPEDLSPLKRKMTVHCLGGGNLTTAFSLLTNPKSQQVKSKNPVKVFEDIISLYPSNPLRAKLDQKDLVNYIVTHIALSCLSNPSTKLAALKQLQTLSYQFPQNRDKCLSSALFLLTLLFWPEDHDTDEEKAKKYGIVHSSVECLQKTYRTKIKEGKRRIYTHFYLGNGSGWEKIVHKSQVASITQLFSLPERRMKWLSGEVWKMAEIKERLKCVSGWTEDGKVYLVGPKEKFAIPPLHAASVPYGNENVTFYLGFTFRGPVACNITKNLQ